MEIIEETILNEQLTGTVLKMSYQALIHDMTDNDLKSIAWTFLEEEKLEYNSFGLKNYFYENMEEDYILVYISFNVRTDNMLLLTNIPEKNREIIRILNESETFTIDNNLLNYKTKKINETYPDNLYNMSFIVTIDNNHEELTEIQKKQLITFYKNVIITNNYNYPPLEAISYNHNIISNIEINFIPQDYRIYTIQIEFEFDKVLSLEMIYEFINRYFNWVNNDVYIKLSNVSLVPSSNLIEQYYHI
jgi:hypothetical protein